MSQYTPEEQAHNRTRWVHALRSGQYRQGAGHLRDNEDRFCCLGVACDLFMEDEGVGAWRDGPASGVIFELGNYTAASYPPDRVRDWLGLATSSGLYRTHDGKEASLAQLNDDGADFEYIANVIELAPRELLREDGRDE